MPTYEYRCPRGHAFDRFCKMSEAQSALACPVCGEQAERQISGGAGLVFKGSGFYITDYGKDGKKDQKAAAKPGESGGSTASGGESKTAEAKPAAGGVASTTSASPSKPASSGGE